MTNQPPLRPTALLNFKKTDDALATIVANFWQLIWGQKEPAIDQKTKYLLSLANAVGARRFRQATRELVKAYAAGTTIAELDELFCLFVWNQGAGEFASEVGPSPLFGAYQLVKEMEKDDSSKEEITAALKSKFGEANPSVGTAGR
jgi:alkylhydroperoxidase/carboxymuconolactone decarboxylase family protein YurZ